MKGFKIFFFLYCLILSANTQLLSQLSGGFCIANSTSASTPSCSLPPEELTTGRLVPGNVVHDTGEIPQWINLAIARKGQKIARDFKINLTHSSLCGLTFLFGFSDISDVLVFTNRSDTPDKATMRYIATGAQVFLWYDNLFTDDDDNVVLTSLKNVRAKHIQAAINGAAQLETHSSLTTPNAFDDYVLDDDMWNAYKRDLDASNIPQQFRTFPSHYTAINNPIPVNQFAQAVTQFAFIGMALMYPERTYISGNEESYYALSHLWAVIGYALGIDDEYNIALKSDYNQIRENYRQIYQQYYLPAIFNLPNYLYGKVLAQSSLLGFRNISNGILTPSTVLTRCLRDVVQIDVANMMASLSLADQLVLNSFDVQYLPLFQTSAGRLIINSALSTGFALKGTQYFGGNYTTERSKAEYVFF